MPYAISTIFLIIYFALIALADFAIWVAPGLLVGVVAAIIGVALVARK